MCAALSVAAVFGACADDNGEPWSATTTRTYPPLNTVAGGDAFIGLDATSVSDTTTGDALLVDTSTQPDTSPHRDTSPPLDTSPSLDTSPPLDTTEPGPVGPDDINTNFIGGMCASAATCTYASSTCITSWPNGHCSQACDRFCPDSAGMTTTFCANGATVNAGTTGGVCLQKCDFGKSPTGCRAGYQCRVASRFNEAGVTASVCLPGSGGPNVSNCIQELISKGIAFELSSNPMDSPGGNDVCDVLDPIRVSGTINGVNFRYNAYSGSIGNMFVRCPVALALWDVAELAKTRNVTDISHLGTYNCRYISGTTNLSQHALANAIDIAGVKLSSGTTYTILGDWERGVANPQTAGGAILRWLATEMHARGIWNIVLTPEFNAGHYDHLHVDLTENADFIK